LQGSQAIEPEAEFDRTRGRSQIRADQTGFGACKALTSFDECCKDQKANDALDLQHQQFTEPTAKTELIFVLHTLALFCTIGSLLSLLLLT
jgi:hypothetical protein